MRIFKVYKHPVSGYEAVKVGFSWPSVFSTGIWLLLKRLWGLFGLWCLFMFILTLIEKVTDQAGQEPGLQAIVYFALVVGHFALGLVTGFKGNGWRMKNLEKRGFKLVQEVQAKAPDAAIAQAVKKVKLSKTSVTTETSSINPEPSALGVYAGVAAQPRVRPIIINAPITRQAGITKLEWTIVALIILIGGSVVVSMYRGSEQKRRHMETASIPLIEALDHYRAANISYPDALGKLVPTYIQELPACNPQSNESGMAYSVDKDSGEYYLNCGVGMFSKRQYSSKAKGWKTWD
jgi:hypothetical protein